MQTNPPERLRPAAILFSSLLLLLSLQARSQPAGIAWGDGSAGQDTIFDGLSNVVQISAGGLHSLALLSNGTVVVAGTYLSSPPEPPPDATNLTRISSGFVHSLALDNQGTVFGWGDNTFGQSVLSYDLGTVVKVGAGGFHSLALTPFGNVLRWGDNSKGQLNAPVDLANVIDVAAGDYHSLALVASRKVVAWGANNAGQISVPTNLTEVVQIAGGASHSLALRGDGMVVSWGSQTNVPPGLSNVVAIAAGEEFSLALKSDGTVIGWGTSPSGAADVPPGLSNIVAVAAGQAHALALFGPPRWPTILANPASVQVHDHSHVQLSVRAKAPGPLTYEWWLNGKPIAGATNATVAITNVNAASVGFYSVFVGSGGYVVESAKAVVSGDTLAVLQSSGSQVAFGGSSPQLSVTVVGAGPISYQWFDNGLAVPGGTNSTLVLSQVQSNATGSYVLVATNSFGSVTNPAIQVVVGYPPRISAPLETNTVTLGQNASFTVQADGTSPLVYQWRHAGTNLPGATNATLSLVRPDLDRAGKYSVLVTNTYGSALASARLVVLVPEGTVRAWGGNIAGDTQVPAGLSNVTAVAAGNNVSFALNADGSITAWGSGIPGRNQPPPSATNVVQLSAGLGHTLALRSDGTVVAWGAGPGTNVPSGLNNVMSIAAGNGYSLVVQSNGALVVWGSLAGAIPTGLGNIAAAAAGPNSAIALGRDGRVIPLAGAAAPPPGLSNVISITGGTRHYLALRDDGTVVAWPMLAGFPETVVPSGLSNVVAIATLGSHDLALRRDGTPIAWGSNGSGESTVPPLVSSNVIGIAAGVSHNLAIMGAPVWPAILTQPQSILTNDHAAVALTVTAASTAPLTYQWQQNGVDLPGQTNAVLSLTDATAEDAGIYRVIVAARNQRVYSQGATVAFSTPAFVNLPAPLAILEAQSASLQPTVIGAPPLVFQWLLDGSPVVGATNTTLNFTNIQPANAGIYQLQAQNLYTNVVSPGIPVTVWRRPRLVTDHGEQLSDSRQLIAQEGDNVNFTSQITGSPPFQFTWSSSSGNIITTNQMLSLTNLQFGQSDNYQCFISNPYINSLVAPALLRLMVLVEFPPGRVAAWGVSAESMAPPKTLSNIVAIAAGFQHNLALLKDGTVTGWGSNQVGQLSIAADQSNVVAIAAAGNYSLAVLDNGLVLGAGQSAWPPPLVPPQATNVALVAAGTNHVLALRKDGSVVAWGLNSNGQLNVPPSLGGVIALAAGATHSLALKRDGTVVGWGGNAFGQAQPLAGLSNVVAIAAGARHSLALLGSGLVLGWGDNSSWQATGSPSGGDSSFLVQLGVTNIIAIAAGDDFSIALRRDGQVIAWGGINRPVVATVPTGLINGVQIAAGPGHGLVLTGVPLALRPVLAIEQTTDGLWLSWPLSATNYFLEGTPSLAAPFIGLNAVAETNANVYRSLVPTTNQSYFFRLNGRF